ncbi:hypothetical protein GCM10027049_17810 [Mucilaginibacter puniceus]
MKNSFKIALLALVIATSFAACGGNKEAETTDTTVVAADSMAVDTMAADTMAADTAAKM